MLRQVPWQEPPRPRKIDPAIPRDLETVVLKATAADGNNRYQTAGDLEKDLRRFLEDRPIRARRTTPVEHLWRWCRRNRAIAALTISVMVSLVAVAVVASVGYFQTTDALDRVSKQQEQAEIAAGAQAFVLLRLKAMTDGGPYTCNAPTGIVVCDLGIHLHLTQFGDPVTGFGRSPDAVTRSSLD